MAKTGTSTSTFGVSRRENHDSTAFYDRFTMPNISTDDTIVAPVCVDRIVDAADDAADELIVDKSAALIVATPPTYDEYKNSGGGLFCGDTHGDYLAMLGNVVDGSVRKLQPGGRIAVIINPSTTDRVVSADIVGVLEQAGLLLRAEIVVVPPTGGALLRVLVASKGRFDRAVPRRDRQKQGLACVSTISTEEFMEATLDVWHLPPVLVPVRLVNLYTYRNELVFDPFADDVTNLQAANDTGRRWFGYRNTGDGNGRCVDDDDPFGGGEPVEAEPGQPKRLLLNPQTVPRYSCQHLARKYGGNAVQVAHGALIDAGFTNTKTGRGGVAVPGTGTKTGLSATNPDDGTVQFFDVVGKYTLSKHQPTAHDWLTAVGKATLIHTLTGQRVVLLATGIANNRHIQGCVGRGKPVSRVVWLEADGCLLSDTTP